MLQVAVEQGSLPREGRKEHGPKSSWPRKQESSSGGAAASLGFLMPRVPMHTVSLAGAPTGGGAAAALGVTWVLLHAHT